MLKDERNDIVTQYGTLITNIGLAQIANAQVTQQKVGLQYIALGDGNGSHYVPTQSQNALVNEVWRGPVANVTIDSMNDNRIIIDGVIPSDVGGFTIREIGIFDEKNQLIAVGQYPEKYKPQLNEGITEETLIHFVIETNNADAVELSIDPTIIVASRKYVDERVAAVNTNLMALAEDFTTHKDNYYNSYRFMMELARQIQRIQVQMELDGRVPGNNGTFADMFDGRANKIILDKAQTAIVESITAGTTVLSVASVAGFVAFTQVTIFDDISSEDVFITAIDTEAKTITVQTLQHNYKKGAKVARSNVNIDTTLAEMSIGDWQTYNIELVEVV